MLTTLFGPIVVLASWNSINKSLIGYYSMLLILQTASLGVFAALDLVVFYVFFELSLIPMYFLIGIWGGSDRIRATVKFFIYTLVGSLIMLVALLYLGFHAGQLRRPTPLHPTGALSPARNIRSGWLSRPGCSWLLRLPSVLRYPSSHFIPGYRMPIQKRQPQVLLYLQLSCLNWVPTDWSESACRSFPMRLQSLHPLWQFLL